MNNTQNPSNLLPVLDILNNLITINSYLSAVQSAVLPSAITSNASYQTLVTDFADWQFTIWEQYYVGLVDANIVAQANVIDTFAQDGISDQNVYVSVINPENEPAPTVVSLCDDVANQISGGISYLTQLQNIASSIQGADEQKIAALNAVVNSLNTQFDQQEQKLTDDAINNTKDLVVSVVNVAVAVGTDQDPIAPLVKGVVQLGTDAISELVLTADIQNTLNQLEVAWAELDEESIELAQINLTITKLNNVVTQESAALTALTNIANDWQTISDVINDEPAVWLNGGFKQITEWSDRMTRVRFGNAAVQNISC